MGNLGSAEEGVKMHRVDDAVRVGLEALRYAVLQVTAAPAYPTRGTLIPAQSPAFGPVSGSFAGVSARSARLAGLLMSEALDQHTGPPPGTGGDRPGQHKDEPVATRIVALVDLARNGDSEAFGQLYDHYNGTVYRFLYYRVGSHALAEDLASETFFRALRSMSGFKWQGRDFGAWLVTIARNLVADHFKAGRTRLEMATDDLSDHDTATPSPEEDVLAGLTNEALLCGLRKLAAEQQECLVLRFLQGMSIAETAQILSRSEGAIKQLQLRAVRNLAKLLPEGIR